MMKKVAHQRLGLSSLLLVILLVCSLLESCRSTNVANERRAVTNSPPNQKQQQESNNSTEMVQKEPENWLMKVLKEYFSDIDFQAIEKARQQVEKFIKRVDKLLKTFRGSNKGTDNEVQSRLFSGNSWWSPKASVDDSGNFKDMLQRVACFVGYMKILNSSNEALAELDTAKVVSNLFNKPSSFSWWG